MAVTTHKTASTNLGSHVVSVKGTLQEVEAELATGSDIGAGYECVRPSDIIAFGGTGTTWAALYVVRT
jgi:hypothetical protein